MSLKTSLEEIIPKMVEFQYAEEVCQNYLLEERTDAASKERLQDHIRRYSSAYERLATVGNQLLVGLDIYEREEREDAGHAGRFSADILKSIRDRVAGRKSNVLLRLKSVIDRLEDALVHWK